MRNIARLIGTALFACALALPTASFAHCDSVAGPVAKDARLALDSGQLSPVLKWIRATDELELRAVFDRALLVRKGGGEAERLADQFFLETAVRLHRASEGEPFTGLKPASAVEEPAPSMVDEALRTNSFRAVETAVSSAIREELAKRIETLQRNRAHAEENPTFGREYVRSYVELVHYIEHLQSPAQSDGTADHEKHAGQ